MNDFNHQSLCFDYLKVCFSLNNQIRANTFKKLSDKLKAVARRSPFLEYLAVICFLKLTQSFLFFFFLNTKQNNIDARKQFSSKIIWLVTIYFGL